MFIFQTHVAIKLCVNVRNPGKKPLYHEARSKTQVMRIILLWLNLKKSNTAA